MDDVLVKSSVPFARLRPVWKSRQVEPVSEGLRPGWALLLAVAAATPGGIPHGRSRPCRR